ncbi:MAG: nonstructural protein [Microviridae sp.]|nr:MAG: nonstructural protein [Microviridae sp.]
MLMQVFSILDVKTGAFGSPFFAFNVSVAQRNVAAAVRDGESMLSKFPGDFQLFQIGSFDDGSGLLEPMVPPLAVCNVASLREVVHAS